MKIQISVENKLKEAFTPTHLEVINESHMHSVPPNSETHFKVVLVTPQFTDMRSVQRHQKVYAVLGELMQQGIHALALHTFTPQEWLEKGQAPDSPNCMGGSKKAKTE
ncbi:MULTISPECIES: BolA family protein [Hahella]|uniref:DNA-binding transcriptional regulator BolA n=2 Tax=Hahella TaxID=158481 RepID=Q2SCD3_HAHCH|nr:MULTISPECIES: BolA/IbaG family iron-sulfur metabolism protein [Hahella]ABC31691.1 stress-induced morphogen [Hahella chejuensis KCTC 2396]AZZ91121.1 BolA family transcriptional regulator [Hahella sp. KA22]MDG9668487.1 BolA/IbaG family iron-sulfur metabolism protein [Hahella sp. CR1]QAY54489.1 BolA family transcriptional regulator [Hahella sp. KA22]